MKDSSFKKIIQIKDIIRNPLRDQASKSGRIICSFCQYPNKLDAGFCHKCEAPTKFDKDQLSIEQIQAGGFGGPEMMTERPKLVIVLGVWIVFFPVFLNILILLIMHLHYFWYSLYNLVSFNVTAFLALIIASWIYRTTKNYFIKSKI